MAFTLIPLLMFVTFAVQDLIVDSYDAGQRLLFAAIVMGTAVAGLVFTYIEYRAEPDSERAKGFLNYFLHN